MAYLRHASRHLAKTVTDRITAHLGAGGWLAVPPFGTTPIEVITRRIRESELQTITGNKVGLFFSDESDDEPAELGGGLMRTSTQLFADVIAVNDAVGLALSSDIKDCLTGRVPGAFRMFKLRDYTTNPLGEPLADHVCEFTTVERSRPEHKETQLFWQVVTAEVELTFPGEE